MIGYLGTNLHTSLLTVSDIDSLANMLLLYGDNLWHTHAVRHTIKLVNFIVKFLFFRRLDCD